MLAELMEVFWLELRLGIKFLELSLLMSSDTLNKFKRVPSIRKTKRKRASQLLRKKKKLQKKKLPKSENILKLTREWCDLVKFTRIGYFLYEKLLLNYTFYLLAYTVNEHSLFYIYISPSTHNRFLNIFTRTFFLFSIILLLKL